MKLLQKLIIPVLLVFLVVAIYIFYLSPKKGLGNFNDFDPNAHIQKEINVLLLADEGIQRNACWLGSRPNEAEGKPRNYEKI